MLIGVISDSHDNLPAIRKAVEEFNKREVDLVLHAGDYISPFAVEELGNLNCELQGVLGNNDGEIEGIKEKAERIGEIHEVPATLEVSGREIILTHKPLEKDFTEMFDLVVNGHTHEPKIEEKNGSLVVNPGESSGWLTGNRTVALVDLEEMEAEIIALG